VRLEPERLVAALLSNLEVWIEDVTLLADTPGPHQRQALHLARNMLQTKLALKRIIGEAEDE
jgi:hypothetical protein